MWCAEGTRPWSKDKAMDKHISSPRLPNLNKLSRIITTSSSPSSLSQSAWPTVFKLLRCILRVLTIIHCLFSRSNWINLKTIDHKSFVHRYLVELRFIYVMARSITNNLKGPHCFYIAVFIAPWDPVCLSNRSWADLLLTSTVLLPDVEKYIRDLSVMFCLKNDQKINVYQFEEGKMVGTYEWITWHGLSLPEETLRTEEGQASENNE